MSFLIRIPNVSGSGRHPRDWFYSGGFIPRLPEQKRWIEFSRLLARRKLNERIRDLRFTMELLLNAEQAKKQHKSELKAEKAQRKLLAKKQSKNRPRNR